MPEGPECTIVANQLHDFSINKTLESIMADVNIIKKDILDILLDIPYEDLTLSLQLSIYFFKDKLG